MNTPMPSDFAQVLSDPLGLAQKGFADTRFSRSLDAFPVCASVRAQVYYPSPSGQAAAHFSDVLPDFSHPLHGLGSQSSFVTCGPKAIAATCAAPD